VVHAHPPATASLPAHKRRVVCYKWKPLLLLWTMLTLGGARGGTAWVLGGRLPHACIANPIDTGPACVSLRGIAWRGVSCRGVAGHGLARRRTKKKQEPRARIHAPNSIIKSADHGGLHVWSLASRGVLVWLRMPPANVARRGAVGEPGHRWWGVINHHHYPGLSTAPYVLREWLA